MDIGMLLLRTVLGLTMAAHGAQKLFGWFGGHRLEGTAGFLGSLGFRPARLHAVLVGVAEFGGGLLLALGLLTPLGAAAVIGVMVAAIAVVHWPKGFFNTNGGFEFNLAMIAGAAAVAFAGPGEYSFDGALGWQLAGADWGLGSLAAGALAAGVVLAWRARGRRHAGEGLTSSQA
ncbi:MAG: DoxX family protein [Actinomycetota bacterium]|nr:DoxX family protein [Actinomycetota bacterium]